MTDMTLLTPSLLLLITSMLLVGAYRQIALHYHWLDTPNQRSSHSRVTPRGAGIVFALLIIGALLTTLPAERARWSLAFGLPIALTGWWDDLRSLSSRARFVIYLVNASAAVTLMVSGPVLREYTAMTAAFCVVIAVIALVWSINLYNFMDGINGIAAIEALFVLLTIAGFAKDSPYAASFAAIHWFASAAIAGFLVWNFPRGKVFMGDAGSAFLGFLIGGLALWSARMGGPKLGIWLILLGVFIVDSSYTLLIRLATGQQWYAAHRLHAYQRLTDRLGGSHVRTVTLIALVDIGWLLPVAWLVHKQWLSMPLGISMSYLPLIAVCYWLQAGVPGPRRV